jgi:small GTP-binding protein
LARAFKIVVTGPFNSGKTTFIRAISEIEVVATEKATWAAGKKVSTTVAMDFGRITLRDGDALHLFGTPGQERFDFMWEILGEGMLGYVVLVDGSDPESLEESERLVRRFEAMSGVPFVVGVTRGDRANCLSPETVRNRLATQDDVDVIICDARKLKDVKDVLLALLERVLESSEEVRRAEAG